MGEIMRVENVIKEYRLGSIGGGTLKGDLQSWWAKTRGKEDPNSKINCKKPSYSNSQRFIAINNVSLSVGSGETLGIIGHNGAGKSTLLKLISGITSPTDGRILLNGRVTSMLEVGTGFHKELTGRENVYLNGAILGMTKKEVSKKFDEIVDFSGIHKFIDTPVKRFSSGMYVKLAFAVAAHLDSEIVIMDEVLAVGDMEFQNKCISKMKSVSKDDGRTILYVSHNMSTIRQLCDRCIVLSNGAKIFDGETEDAIGMYLGSISSGFQTHYDLSMARRCDNSKGGIFVTSIDLLDTDCNIFQTGNRIKIHCNVDSHNLLLSVQIMMIISAKDGTRIGMADSPAFNISTKQREISFSFFTDSIPDGDYFVELNFVQRDALGGYDKLDGIIDAFSFHIQNKKRLVLGMDWKPAIWGYSTYKKIEIN